MSLYHVTVIDNETGRPAVVNGLPVEVETDTLLILWEEPTGLRKIGLNQTAWMPEGKRHLAIACLLEMVENLCRSKDPDVICGALAKMLADVEEMLEGFVGPEGAARALAEMAEHLAKKAVLEKGAQT